MTEGNPFFLHEVLRQMAADGQLASGASTGSDAAQHSARRQRIHQAADAAACRKRRADARRRLGARARVLPQRARGREGRRRAKPDRRSSIRPPRSNSSTRRRRAGRYSFRHALIREALYDACRRRGAARCIATSPKRSARSIADASRSPRSPTIIARAPRPATPSSRSNIRARPRGRRSSSSPMRRRRTHLRNAIEALALKRRRRRCAAGGAAVRSRRSSGQDRRSRGGAQDLPEGDRTWRAASIGPSCSPAPR